MTDHDDESNLQIEDPMNEADPSLEPPSGDRELIASEVAQPEEQGNAIEEATPCKKPKINYELKNLGSTNKPGGKEDILQPKRNRPSLLAVRGRFREAYKKVRSLVEDLSRWEDPILPAEIPEFESDVRVAAAEDG